MACKCALRPLSLKKRPAKRNECAISMKPFHPVDKHENCCIYKETTGNYGLDCKGEKSTVCNCLLSRFVEKTPPGMCLGQLVSRQMGGQGGEIPLGSYTFWGTGGAGRVPEKRPAAE